MPNVDLIGSGEVAEMLGISRTTVRRRVVSGDLPEAIKLPGRRGARFFDRGDIERIARESRTSGKDPQ